jgi:hypothetical protein
MSAPFFTRWPAAAAGLLLAAALAPARPPADLDGDLKTITDLKPVAAADGDAALLKLQKERFNTRLKLAQTQVRLYRAGASAIVELVDAVNRLAQCGIELEAVPADRLKWHQLRVNLLKAYEDQAEQAVKAGTSTEIHLLNARATRLDAEIELQKLKDATRDTKSPGEK